uniref:Endonuclease/exonuclease/phosphatase domain-containing protein n=1 Tax=Panagrolaimus sp. ES5 TaxID=591445 RepID=A0AC34G2D9_9BILA
MTFNTWLFGGVVNDGLYKLSKHIKLMQPDIVALQEVQTQEGFQELLDKLGPGWNGVTSPSKPNANVGIVTIHQIDNSTTTVAASNTAIGVNIHIKDTHEIVSFWCLHLAYLSYGPYAANNKQVTQLQQIMQGEYPDAHDGRGDNIEALLKTPEFQNAVKNSDENALIVCGDFNSPSHLDWIEETKRLHGGWVVQWPATYLLQTKTGLLDSFRELYPSPIVNPGITWSTVNRASGAQWDYMIPEPLDRIDFIMFKSPTLKPVHSFTYFGNEPLKQIPNHKENDYPSDHFSVVTDFTFANF